MRFVIKDQIGFWNGRKVETGTLVSIDKGKLIISLIRPHRTATIRTVIKDRADCFRIALSCPKRGRIA